MRHLINHNMLGGVNTCVDLGVSRFRWTARQVHKVCGCVGRGGGVGSRASPLFRETRRSRLFEGPLAGMVEYVY